MATAKANEAGKDGKDGKDPGAEPKKGGKKKLLIILTAIVLAAAGGGGYMMLSGGGKSSTATKAKPKPVAGAVLALDALTVNLAEGHYLKVKLSLQLTASAAANTDGSKALDLAIEEFSDKALAELSSATGRAKIKEDLLTKLETAYPEEVMDVYFTQFVMQ